MRDPRGQLPPAAALGFAGLAMALYALRSWLDSWSGIGHVSVGTGWERTPWHAMQRAAWEVLRRTTGGGASK